MRIRVEYEDHVPQFLSCLSGLCDESPQQSRPDPAILRAGQERDVEQSDLLGVAADPQTADRLSIKQDHIVFSVWITRVILAPLRRELHAQECFLLPCAPLDLREFFRPRAGINFEQKLFVAGCDRTQRNCAHAVQSDLCAATLHLPNCSLLSSSGGCLHTSRSVQMRKAPAAQLKI